MPSYNPPQDNGTALTLSSPARLPTFANHHFIVREAKRADVIWSEGHFIALCEHMLNENSPNHFSTAWIDQGTGHVPEKKSRWAAIDFDAHNGEHEQRPLGLVTPEQISAVTKVSADAPACGTSSRKRRGLQVTMRRASSRAAK
jgi:hypothetical protein